MDISAGARVRSFEVLAPLGAGGMGAVYRARDANLGRQVAIKFLKEKLSDSREHLHRFKREARAASALNHPNIITIYDIGEHEGAPFIAMELVEGCSLRDLLKKGPLPVRKLLDIAVQIADGLAAAHEQGILHRDLKPDNVMLTTDGRVKILDFGLARVSRPVASSDTTSDLSTARTPAGQVLGTAAYVSPEQATGARSIDHRSDQFSLGSLLYELATGRRAFGRASTIETLAAIAHDDPEPLHLVNPRLPPPLVWIIDRCLSKDPAERYASTRDLAHELRTLRERLPETFPGVHRMPWSSRRRLATVAIVVAVIAGAVAMIVAPQRFRRAAPVLPDQKVMAVLPFKDLSGRPDGQLFTQGFSEAVSSRLSSYSGLQVIPPELAAPWVKKNAGFRRIAQELGATLLLNASVQRAGETFAVNYAVIDPDRGTQIAGGAVNGSVQNIWTVQDEVVERVARDLGITERPLPARAEGLESPEQQDLYLTALGHLDRFDNEQSIDSAIDALRELAADAPNSTIVHAALARAYLAKYNLTRDSGWTEKAVRAADRANELRPDSADVLFSLGEVQWRSGRATDAIATFGRALSIQPNFPEAAIGLGTAFKAAGQYEESEQAFRRGIQLRPAWWSGYNQLGSLYLSLNRLPEAAAQFQEVIRLNPHSPWGYNNLGVTYIRAGELSKAADAFRRALAVQPDADAYSNLGYYEYLLGEYEKSAASFQKATELRPSVGTHWANLGDACVYARTCRDRASDFYRTAIDLLREELRLNPQNARAHATLAVCLAKTGELTAARRHIAQALRLEPENGTRLYQAARVANIAGERDEALERLQQAVANRYPRFDIARDPEFRNLRSSSFFQGVIEGGGAGESRPPKTAVRQ